MLTPVVSKKKKKHKKCDSGRSIAKDLILRRDVAPAAVVKPQPPAASPAQPVAKPVQPVQPGASAFTDEELAKLDTLYDIVSWLVYLYSGDYTKMNEHGSAIGFKPMTADMATAVKAKLKDKIAELVGNIDKVVAANEPIAPSAVSDIKNQIEVLT